VLRIGLHIKRCPITAVQSSGLKQTSSEGEELRVRSCAAEFPIAVDICSRSSISSLAPSVSRRLKFDELWIGHAVAQLVEALHYIPVGHGFDSR
jgi:hypothetical protein